MKNKTIIFLGDSITECYNLDKHFSHIKLINKGKSGDTTVDILNRLNESIFMLNPDVVFLLIGTNDLELLSSRPKQIIKNITKIINEIKNYNNNITIFLQSIYPVNPPIKPFSVGKRTNKDILEINNEIKKITLATYIDVASVLTDSNGNLNKEYTYDGIHINIEGYNVITKYLSKYLK